MEDTGLEKIKNKMNRIKRMSEEKNIFLNILSPILLFERK
jgi:hypothetical protein